MTDVITLLLENGADINHKNVNGWTPLHRASWNDQTDTVTLLIWKKADVNCKSHNGWTPLHHASYLGHTDTAEVLINAETDINAKTDKKGGLKTIIPPGCTPLDIARKRDHKEIVKYILNETQREVFEAAGENDWKRTKKILEDCPSVVDHKTGDGETLLHLAAWWNHDDLVGLLKDQYKNDLDHWSKYIERTNRRGLTALHIAAQKGNSYITELLLRCGADFLAPSLTGQTPLHFAVLWGHEKVAWQLVNVSNDPHSAVNAMDDRKITPLYLATMKKDKPILKILQSSA